MVLDDKDVRAIERVAKAESLSMSWLIRRAIRQWLESIRSLPASKPTPPALRKKDPLLSVIGIARAGGISNLNIDEEVYER